MNIEQFREKCLKIKGVEECFPFHEDVLVFKVMGKMFAFVVLFPKDGEFRASMKCNPERSAELRERYEGVTKGFYTGDTLKWNSVYFNRDVPDNLIKELIQHSADEVIKGLSKKMQKEYLEIPAN
ncbi:MAG: MmcQ/YjbR family DNA-binding protein [Bacteroidales bacterium]|nr:MmcQ/YjbR family DNA-binding protein [Bacteroidales bacterium]